MFPNIYELLKSLSVFPVSTATAKKNFSALRMYFKSTISESRLLELALLYIYRHK